MVKGRRMLSLDLLLLRLALAGLLMISASASTDVNEQKQVRSCLSGLFSCFPSDVNDPSPTTCSDSSNFSCSHVCPSNGQSFFDSLWSSKYDQLSEECDTKYCYSELDSCLGSVLHTAYSSGDWYTACRAWNQQLSCISEVNSSCTDKQIYSKYFNFFTYGCANNDSIAYLTDYAKCFPFSFFDLTNYPDKAEICKGAVDASFCGADLVPPASLSSPARSFFDDLLNNYTNDCSATVVCATILSGCLGAYVNKPLPPSLLQQLICSNLQDLDKCVNNLEYECSYPVEIKSYLTNSCSELVCEAGLESCYSQFQQPFDYSSDVATVVDSFCSVNENMSACLDTYQESCTAAQNADSSFRATLAELCQGNNVVPGDCYWSALKCFYQYYPTLTKPSALWSTNADTTFCSTVDATVSCLNSALSTCGADTGRYPDAIKNIRDVIGFQCSSVCSDEKVAMCQDSMTYYLTQLWTNATSNSSLCGVLSQQQSCYSTLTKQCSSGAKDAALNVAVINSILVAIERSSCNFSTVPVIPTGCDMSTAVSYMTSFLSKVYQATDMSANNYSLLCQQWSETKALLTSVTSSCTGGVNAAVSGVDAVIISLCSGQCMLEETAQNIKDLSKHVQDATHFKPPVDYKGRPRKLFCKSKGEDSSDDDVCYDYKFYWGAICLDINSTLSYVAQDVGGCSDMVKKTQLESVHITADVFYKQCQEEKYTCNVELGTQCLTNFSTLGIYYPLLSSSEKQLACNLAVGYTECIWKNLVQCSPFFYLDTWAVVQTWHTEWKCTPPGLFDNSNSNQTLNITKYEKQCSADLIVRHMEKFTRALISHSINVSSSSLILYSQWKETSTEITSVTQSVASSGQCSVFTIEIDVIKYVIDIVINRINDNDTDCYLEDANACVASLEKFVNLNSLKKPPCGCPVKSTDKTKSEFCSRAKDALDCISESAAMCNDESVADVYASLYKLQDSTGLTCVSPCDSGPCQHGSICSNGADLKSYQCKCSIGFSGKNCEKSDCDKKQIYDCFESTAVSLVAANYTEYCLRIAEAKMCIAASTQSCPSAWFDVANLILQQLMTNLGSHCDAMVPVPSPDCDSVAVTCLSQSFSGQSKLWDLEYGGFLDSVCSQWVSVTKCIGTTNSQCGSGTYLSVETVFSFLCTSISVPCKMQKLAKHCDDLAYGHWRAAATQPRKTKDYNSPDDDLGDLRPKRKNKKAKKDKKEKSTDCDSALIPLLCVHG